MPYDIYNSSLARTERDFAMRTLREMGVVSADVGFSGGNDEGGVNEILLTMKDGSQSALKTFPDRYWDKDEQEYVNASLDEMQVKQNRLWEILSIPVYQRYSTFAGEFYVYGSVIWDVEKNTVSMSGSEDVPVSNSIGGSW